MSKRGGRPLTLPQGVLPQNWDGTKLNLTVPYMVLRATANHSGYGHELVAGVSWARVLLPLKIRRVDEAIPTADVVVRKQGCQLRCPRHSTKVQNYEVCDQ
ncbi:hypothetical protein TNCV_213581 [Trichonephila clavipes]|nr:hypothetical protein TNCV_213581 [Trichonephila clavipes]